ncbi:MAG: hypothetical protein ACRD2I_05220 [Vicinamibacterales bacterium]
MAKSSQAVAQVMASVGSARARFEQELMSVWDLTPVQAGSLRRGVTAPRRWKPTRRAASRRD